MIAVIFLVVGVAVSGLLLVEILRWTFRSEARRLRVIKKIGGRR